MHEVHGREGNTTMNRSCKNNPVLGSQIGLSGLILLGALTWHAEAAIGMKDSSAFPNKYEMNNAAEGVDPDASTASWDRFSGGSPSPTASLSGGLLNIDSSANVGQGRWWQTTSTLGNDAVGATIETRLRINSGIASAGYGDSVFQVWLGDSNHLGHLVVGTMNTYWYVGSSISSTLSTLANNDGFHTFRVYEDASSTTYNVARDDVVI